MIADNQDVLRLTLSAGLPHKQKGDGPIAPLQPGTEPNRPPFKLSPSENEEVKRQLQT